MCRRIAAFGEWQVRAGWREESGFRIYRFTTWAKARAMQHWIDRSGIANRPMPRLGLSPEEVAERNRQALAWGLDTGAVGPIAQAWLGNAARRAIQESFGIMVNYLYDHDSIEDNHEVFERDGTIVRSPDADTLLEA